MDETLVARTGAPAQESDADEERLLYILRPVPGKVKLEFAVARRLKAGGYGLPRVCYVGNLLNTNPPPPFLRPLDVELARKVMLAQRVFNTWDPMLEGVAGAALLKEILATGRCHWRGGGKGHPSLTLGEARTAKPEWRPDAQGRQHAGFAVEPEPTAILPFAPPWFVDEKTGTCGPLETGLPDDVALAWLNAPPVAPDVAEHVTTEIAKRAERVRLPTPRHVEVETVGAAKPVPCLRLYAATVEKTSQGYGYDLRESLDEEINFAHLDFDYDGVRVGKGADEEVVEAFSDGKLRRVFRDVRLEEKAEALLFDAGLDYADSIFMDRRLGKLAEEFAADEPEHWFKFVQETLPKLRKKGWRIETDESFRFRLVEAEAWYGDAEAEAGSNWFGVELGVVVDGQKVNLLPILLRLIQQSPDVWTSELLAQMPDDGTILVPLSDGRKLPFPVARARSMLGVLLELMDPASLNPRGKLRLSKLRAAELAGDAGWRWLGNSDLADLARRLRSFDGIQPVAPPPQLRATLRPYQQEGLNWLQFLRDYDLGGILADDMGLGKTVQALAHLLAEKDAGRLDKPCLVVAPTSLMTNWRQEAERFAPALRVLVLHGLDRKQHFERITDHDLIITSYPLLPRDAAVLLEQEFHYVILDEAQFIKNPKTTYAQVACQLKARHRLCLTGTPMENHLGELWSLFHFLLPGFLGDENRFNTVFRRPIEKGRSDERRQLLARRVAPFLLRRKKEQVALELPPKTEIVQHVELTGAQRDLYESVRLAMHERVRAEVDTKGLSRSHIIILDALLKLRQICCHPQLLSLPSAQKVKDSAKLELLMDLLPEMLEEGRRILLFSQFTSMLAIIQAELDTQKIPYVLLTGQTTDRATPVNRFQNGEVPLFLISLKAGGTGLNLTAADTVIHYDPWWNPAVENQATDRAHRIGQDKKVFVYKLMTVGTVEEKIAAMQARKRELVEGLLDDERRDNLKLTPEDLDLLFAPLQ
jgi:superfamily II DNA or RNA helicase